MTILLALIALGILIVVHEFGHFITAKLCGVWVERFSIGFGPRLLTRQRGETEYALSAIPLGGYVKLHRMFEDEPAVEGMESKAFYNKPLPKKLLVIMAGVIFNIIFAALLFALIFMIGYKSYSPIVGNVEEGSSAYTAGMMPQDRIISVNGQRVRSWDEYLLALKETGTATVLVSRSGEELTMTITPEFIDYESPITGQMLSLVDAGATAWLNPIIGSMSPGFPAEKAGLMAGDKIISINGEPVVQWQDIGSAVRPRVNMLTEFIIERNGEVLRVGITPIAGTDSSQAIVGIMPPDGDVILREGFFASLALGAQRTWDVGEMIIRSIGMLVTGKVSKDNLGGPVLIVQEGARSAEGGYERYLSFIALISINLAILNILPIPVLDGGYVVMFIYESIRRKRLSIKAREKTQMVGFALLGLLMIFAFYNDIVRILS